MQLILPTQADLDIGDGDLVDLDKHADDDVDKCQDVADCEVGLVGSYRAPTGHLLQPPPEQVNNALEGTVNRKFTSLKLGWR